MFVTRGVRVPIRGSAALAILLFSAFASRSAAQPVWQKIGPWVQGDVLAVAVDPRMPQHVYVGSSGGLFKSSNFGSTWQPSAFGIESTAVPVLAIDPKTTTRVYAGTDTGIYRSKDGAATWTLVFPTRSLVVTSLAVNPSNTSVIFATANSLAVAPTAFPSAGILLRSVDGGSNWLPIDVAVTKPVPYHVWIDPLVPARVFAATAGGVFRSDDSGAHWALKLPTEITDLSFDPSAAGLLYIATTSGDNFAIQQSVNAGDSWAPVAGPLDQGSPPFIYALAQVPGPPATLYASTSAGLFKTTDVGAVWTQAATGVSGTVGVLVPFGAPENSVYAGSTAGLFKLQTISTGAVRLDSPFASLGTSCFVSIPGKGAALYAGTSSGVYRSSGGSTWKAVNSGLSDLNIRALAMSPQAVVCITAPCTAEPPLYAGTASGIFKSTNQGASWGSANRSLPSRFISALAVDPVDPNTVYAVTGGGVAKSANGGSDWAAANQGLSSLAVQALAVDPTVSGTLYCSTTADLFKSTDFAATWTPLHAGFAATSLAVSPTSPATVYATAASKPYRSDDGGGHWTPVPLGAAATETPSLLSIAVDPNTASIAHTGSDLDGVFQTTSGGADWTPFDVGLPREPSSPSDVFPSILQLDWDRSTQTILTAATPAGLFSVEPTPQSSSCTPASDTLCLGGGRFRLTVAWDAANLGTHGTGQAVPLTSDTGYFWFFQPTNVELMIKVLDARALNGHFWVFFGALSNVEYEITVTDTATGEERVYRNPQGSLSSVADTAAFPVSSASAASSAGMEEALARETAGFEALEGVVAGTGAPEPTAAAAPCTASATALCLTASRFRVEVTWAARHLGTSGVGQAVPLTADTGYFWFFQSSNVELVIKVLDARSFSGHFWVFYGALSNVEYTIKVTDTVTGQVKTYFNPQDHLASVADTAAF